MKWTKQVIPFTFSYFVIWKHMNDTFKGRIIINI